MKPDVKGYDDNMIFCLKKSRPAFCSWRDEKL